MQRTSPRLVTEASNLPEPAEQRRTWRAAVAETVGEPFAWMSSFATHALFLSVLALWTQLAPIDQSPLLFTTPLPDLVEPEEEAFRVSEELSIDVGALADGGAGDAAASAPAEAMLADVSLDMDPIAEVGQLPTLEVQAAVLTSPDPDERLLVRGVGAVGVSGSRGAVDRLTGEILQSLEQRATLVVWLFDRSGSLGAQREKVVKRFDQVYDQLGVAGFGSDGATDDEDAPLLTTVAAFGADVEFVTKKPTADVEAIKAAVESIEPDDSGQENVFGAVVESVERHKRHRLRRPRRNVMIVVFTDEAGDDQDQLDRAVDVCRKLQTPVYVVGAPAPFGRLEAYVRYVDPDPDFDQTPQWLPVRQGPESLLPERLRLGYFGRGDFNGPTLDSGFGPFGLTRLTAETGGFYIAVHPFRVETGRANRRQREELASEIDYFFDERLMRRYRPDYVPTAEYQRRLAENVARQALVNAASLSWTAPLTNVRLDFPKTDDAEFVNSLTRAQRVAAVLEPQLQRLVETLRRGELGRPDLESPRWRAGFDLAMGRALASKVRAEGYNDRLAEAKLGMEFTSEQKDTWVLSPADDVAGRAQAEAEASAAKEYLNRVVDEHDGTPWALLAQRELSRPMGWEWRDEFRNIEERRERRANNRNRPNRPQREAKPRRNPPKL